MASAVPLLSDRDDIRKSCKSLETLFDAFNDYCKALNAIIVSQKRLFKALREVAGLKATGQIAANTLNASACIFEDMSEINSKFGKIADRECDDINSELKKWFKKLAKEEKAHDEKMNNFDSRIKQAGNLYETKTKKNPRDASEEHTQYINLISTLGPEIAQDKQKYALLVTRGHTLATNSLAACLSRIADTEWLRSCEEVRRFASKIGQLGECRALCEGGWTGAVPQDLPNLGDKPEQSSDHNNTQLTPPKRSLERKGSGRDARARTEQIQPNERDGAKSPRMLSLRNATTSSAEPFLSRKPSFAQQSKSSSPTSLNAASNQQKVIFAPSEKWTDAVSSVTSLSSFPSPPVHVHDAAGSAELDLMRPRPRPLPIQFQPSSPSPSPNSPRLLESPKRDPALSSDGPRPPRPKSPRTPRTDLTVSPLVPTTSSNTQEKETANITEPLTQTVDNCATPSHNMIGRSVVLQPMTQSCLLHTPDASQPVERSSSDPNSARTSGSATSGRDKEPLADDFGSKRSGMPPKPKNLVDVEEQEVERRDSTTSTNIVVATIRGRYGAPASSPSKDGARSLLSVSGSTSRSQSTEDRSLQRPQVALPIGSRQLRFPATCPGFSQGEVDLPSPPSSTGDEIEGLDCLLGQQETMGGQGRDSDERTPGNKYQKIEMKIPELEKENNQIPNPRDSGNHSPSNDDFAAQATSLGPLISRKRYSVSTAQLPSPTSPPPSSSFINHPYAQSQDQASNLDHAPFCGCATCSASKYKARSTPTPYDLRPPEPPITVRPQKLRGWIHRITDPVGNAFSLDSRRSSSALKNGTVFSATAGEDGKLRRSYERSSPSVANLGRR